MILRSTKEIMSMLAEMKYPVPAFVYKELRERDKQIDSLQKQLKAVKAGD